MNVLIVNTSDIQGGAARAAYRLHQALLAAGVDSRMLVQSKASDDFRVIGPDGKLQKAWGKLRPTLDSLPVQVYERRTKTPFSSAWLPFGRVVERINALAPDVVHLHWIAGGLMPVGDIARIKAPVVWSLHDMWAFTGGCHYDEDCGAWRQACGQCKVLGSDRPHDLSSRRQAKKQAVFASKRDMTIVGLSRWLYACSKNSALLQAKAHVQLPNPIDTGVFMPFDQAAARRLWGLPEDKKLVLFGAMGATSDPRKGFNELSQALRKVQTADVALVVFGSSPPQNAPDFGFQTHYLGHLHDDVSLVTLYGAADVMVVPSLQENLSNAIMESLACGTPVVAFDIGGNPDLVDHQTNGYLAQPYHPDDLAKGIDWVLQHADPQPLAKNARNKILENFESSIVAKKYIALYRQVVSKESQ